MAPRQYQRIRTLPPDYWAPELRQAFELWLKDMAMGMRPYTPRTTQTFERRFVLYTRRGWEGKSQCLTLEDVFHLPNIYTILSQYPVESYSNRHNMLYSLISFGKFLVSLNLLDETIVDKMRKLRPRRVTPPRKTVLREEDEVEQIRKAIREKRYEAEYSRLLDQTIFETFIHTGLRVAELCQLNLEDVDFAQGMIHVKLGKGRKSRKVGILKALAPVLQGYLEIRHLRITQEKTAFFLNRRGSRLTTADVTRRLLRLSRLAGIEITAHGLRRTFATLNANQGRPLHLIQLALGHSDIRTTQEYLMSNEAQVVHAMRGW